MKQITTNFSRKRQTHLTATDKRAIKGAAQYFRENEGHELCQCDTGRIRFRFEKHTTECGKDLLLVTRKWNESSATLGRKIEKSLRISLLFDSI